MISIHYLMTLNWFFFLNEALLSLICYIDVGNGCYRQRLISELRIAGVLVTNSTVWVANILYLSVPNTKISMSPRFKLCHHIQKIRHQQHWVKYLTIAHVLNLQTACLASILPLIMKIISTKNFISLYLIIRFQIFFKIIIIL